MKKTDRNYVELDLATIKSANENIRDTVPTLTKLGYGVFKPEKHKKSLFEMALSGDSQDQAQFVWLIEQHESSIKELADNMTTTGQLEPIRVRTTDNKNEYDLVFGARRTIARIYIYAKSTGKVPARLTAEIVEADGKDSLYASISENIRSEPSPIDEAKSYDRLKKSFGMNAKEIAAAMGKGEKAVRNRLKLMKLPKDMQEKVHLGKLGVERALKHLDGKADNGAIEVRRAPTIRQIEYLYRAAADSLPDELSPLITEDVRRLFAHWLGAKYEPLPEPVPEAALEEQEV